MTRFADVELGDELPEHHPDVSRDKVRLFVSTTDMEPGRFTDDDEARRQGLPAAIVPGIMSQGFLSVMIHAWAPGSRIRTLDTVFRTTMLVDSHPVCRGAVTDIVDEEQRLVELDLTVIDDKGVTAVMGTATVELVE